MTRLTKRQAAWLANLPAIPGTRIVTDGSVVIHGGIGEPFEAQSLHALTMRTPHLGCTFDDCPQHGAPEAGR